jgi:hypothetical protein
MPRFQIDMPDHKIKALQQLMEDCGLATKKDLVNNALTLFQWAVDEKKHGNTIAAIDRQTKVYRELQMPSLNEVRVIVDTAKYKSAG